MINELDIYYSKNVGRGLKPIGKKVSGSGLKPISKRGSCKKVGSGLKVLQ